MTKIGNINRTITSIMTMQKVSVEDLFEACRDIAKPLEELFYPSDINKDYPYLTDKTQVERCRYLVGEIKNYANKTNNLQLVTSIENSIYSLKSTNPEIYKTWMIALGKPIYMRGRRKYDKLK
jgi:hypothetical protein